MFVRNAKYEEEKRRRLDAELDYLNLKVRYFSLVEKWDNLVRRINKKGGEEFLEKATLQPVLSKEDVNKLLSLCHPDKHDGKESAKVMTQKLLNLRKTQYGG